MIRRARLTDEGKRKVHDYYSKLMASRKALVESGLDTADHVDDLKETNILWDIEQNPDKMPGHEDIFQDTYRITDHYSADLTLWSGEFGNDYVCYDIDVEKFGRPRCVLTAEGKKKIEEINQNMESVKKVLVRNGLDTDEENRQPLDEAEVIERIRRDVDYWLRYSGEILEEAHGAGTFATDHTLSCFFFEYGKDFILEGVDMDGLKEAMKSEYEPLRKSY